MISTVALAGQTLGGPGSPKPSGEGSSKWVYVGADGHPHYGADERGNRIMDFSHARYKGGGVPLPNVERRRTNAELRTQN